MSTLRTPNFTEYTDIDDADWFLTLLGEVALGTMIILTIILKTVVRPCPYDDNQP
ncbi:hypothetical protein VHARVF571_510129 [Vibrio harveyi]|uniref:hypothetical protein n=1 Tax=Vibrio harveyi TaxID=669 RepID=UPI002895777C|nr:hypothetical protein VHARVF571_510129 [Vibrio harveyi]